MKLSYRLSFFDLSICYTYCLFYGY